MNPITKEDLSRLFDCRLALIDEMAVQHFWFSRDGTVAVTLGAKDGPIAGPLMYWSLTRDGRLLITSARLRFPFMIGRPYLEWTGIKFAPDTVTVDTPVGPRVYTVQALSDGTDATA
jgi:hypothetical protein